MAEPRDDPQWREAQALYVEEPRADEDPDGTYHRRIKAAAAMWLVSKSEPEVARRFIESARQ